VRRSGTDARLKSAPEAAAVFKCIKHDQGRPKGRPAVSLDRVLAGADDFETVA
jgi:hypothetical protein